MVRSENAGSEHFHIGFAIDPLKHVLILPKVPLIELYRCQYGIILHAIK